MRIFSGIQISVLYRCHFFPFALTIAGNGLNCESELERNKIINIFLHTRYVRVSGVPYLIQESVH